MSLQNTFILDVDFKKSNFINEPVVTQNDDVTFILNVFNDGMEYDFTTVSTSTLVSVRPDRQSVMTLGTKTGNNQITFTMGSTELSKVGKIKAVIQLYGVDGRVSTLPFTYQVLKDPATDYVPSTNEKTLIELVLGQGPAILTAAEEATQEALEAAEIARNAEGPMGPQGPNGDRGATGVQGPKGDTGATGATGPQGQQGPKGDKGPKGDNFTVDASGLFSNRSTYDGQPIGFSYLATDTASLYIRQGTGWSAPIPFGKGEQGEIGPMGPQGPKGEQGNQGPKGDTGLKGDKGEPGTTVWDGINGKPKVFPPEGHNHTISQVTGLQDSLNSKFNINNARADSMDLNNYWIEGKYAVGTGYLNGPANENLGNIIVYISGEIVTQVGYTTDGNTFTRTGTLLMAGSEITGVGWNEWMASGSGSGGGGEYIHVGDFTPGAPNYGYDRFDVSKYRKVKFFIDGIQKGVYSADVTAYAVELELWTPFGTTNTHTQRVTHGTGPSGASGDRLRLLNVPADSNNNLPYKVYGEVEIDLEDPIMYTKSRMYYLHNSMVTGVSDDTSGRSPQSITNIEGNRTYHRRNIPQHVTFRHHQSVNMGRIRMYGIPR